MQPLKCRAYNLLISREEKNGVIKIVNPIKKEKKRNEWVEQETQNKMVDLKSKYVSNLTCLK